MVEKGIMFPAELAELYVHKWTPDEHRLRRMGSYPGRRHVKVRNPTTGDHSSGVVIDTTPILTRDMRGGRMILNGMHRSMSAVAHDVGLVYYNIESVSDIRHALPRSTFGDMRSPMYRQLGTRLALEDPAMAEIIDFFLHAEQNYNSSAQHGVRTLADYMTKVVPDRIAFRR
jgi:hypothetical protein